MSSLQVVLHTPVENQYSFSVHEKLVIHLTDMIKVIPIKTIEFIQAASNYSIIHLTEGKNIMVSKTLKSITESLNTDFIRTHKSYVVNLNYVSEYNIRNGTIQMESKKEALVSRSNKAMMRSIFSH